MPTRSRRTQSSGSRPVLSVELLECRTLMATFEMPSLGGLAGGRHIAATFNRLVGSLHAQISIQAPKDTAPDVLASVVSDVVDQYEAASREAFAAFPGTLSLLVQQGEALDLAINSMKSQYDVGLLSRSSFNYDAYQEIQQLTLSREVWVVGTPLTTFLVMARETSDDLASISTAVQTTTSITPEQAANVLQLEAEAFQGKAILGATRLPAVANPIRQATTNFVTEVNAALGQPDFAARVAEAADDFADALVNPGGTFGPGGSIGRRIPQPPVVPTPLSIEDAATFTNLQYRQLVTSIPVTLSRNFSSESTRYGRFMTTVSFASPAEAIRRLALDQSWYGTDQAYFVEDVYLPAGTLIYIGRVAPIYQGIYRREARPSLYPGGAPQYLVANTRAEGIVWNNFRATGTGR